ncbi:hypothetical protein EFN40_02660 [Pediococcus parvulus]|jgi:hypothetical protein|nr:hypothetical protein [Pediococcus parvulus]
MVAINMPTRFKIGMLVKCKKCDDLDYPFIGKIMNILRTKLVIEILQVNYRERYKAALIQYNTVVEAKNCIPIRLLRVNINKENYK